MTPKEKAEDLIKDFFYDIDNNDPSCFEAYMTYFIGLQCALACVDNIQYELIKLNSNKSLELFNYYQDVKKELKNKQ